MKIDRVSPAQGAAGFHTLNIWGSGFASEMKAKLDPGAIASRGNCNLIDGTYVTADFLVPESARGKKLKLVLTDQKGKPLADMADAFEVT